MAYKNYHANSMGIAVILVWSIYPLLIIGTGKTPAFLLVSLSLFIAGSLLILRNMRQGTDLLLIMRQSIQSYILVVTGFTGYLCALIGAFKLIPAYEANTLNYLWPILLSLFSLTLIRKRPSLQQYMGFIIGFIGVALCFFPDQTNNFSSSIGIGHFLALLAAIIWAGYSALTRYIVFDKEAMGIYMLLSGAICLVMHFIFESSYTPNSVEWGFIFLFGLTRISFAFWDSAMKNGDTLVLSSLANCIPLFSSVMLLFIEGDKVTQNYALSSVCIITSCLIIGFNTTIQKLNIKNLLKK
ncbi:MAG: DMT family transporter [Bdellovibrionales bacterium]